MDRDGARIVDTATAEVVIEFDSERVRQLFWPLWSPGGGSIATISAGSVHLWNSLTAELMRSLETGVRGVPRLAWSPNESHVAAIGSDGVLRVFDAADGTRVF